MARKRKKNKAAIPMGIITIILAVIGLISVIKGVSGIIENRKDNMYLKEQYEEFLKPVVMFDPDPFDDLTQADNSQLLYAAVWDLLLDEEGTSKYSYSQGESFGIVVPEEDIKEHFEKLFGTEIDFYSIHDSVDISIYDISYDAALKSYILPITGVDSAYVPKIYSIDKQGTSLVLKVGYIGNLAWADIDEDEYEAPEPDKFMKITLRDRGKDTMFVSSIQETDNQEYASQMVTTTKEYSEEEEVTEEAEETTEVTESTDVNVEIVPITDENGLEVTDENGEVLTETVTTPAEDASEDEDEESEEVEAIVTEEEVDEDQI